MHQKIRSLALALIFIFVSPISAHALDISVSGFGTLCASKSDIQKESFLNVPIYAPLPSLLSNKPYVAQTFYRPTYVGADRRWNMLTNSKFALQFTSIFDDKFKAVVQLIGRWETMTYEHYTAKMDWAYVQYNATNQLDMMFGRFRVPAFYYSDYLDVNNAQPWVMAPDEVYFIVGGAFRNMDGVKARYSYYINDWTLTSQAYYGTMEEDLFILFNDVHVKVRDVVGVAAQLDNDFVTLRGSLMRAIYDTNLYGNLLGLVSASETSPLAPTAQSRYLRSVTFDKNKSIIYVGLAANFNITDKINFLTERASIMSPGIISTARVGWYSSLTYSMDKFAYTFTYGFSRPLQTEYNKYKAVNNWVNTSQYQALDQSSGAGAAIAESFRSYLGRQRSYALDVRYDILPALALKGSVKYVKPLDKGKVNYLLNRLPVLKHIWVYRMSLDFVF